MVASIRGAYNQAQSSFLARNGDEGTFTFDNIPVGRKVYAEVKVYTFEPDFDGDETRYYYFIQEASGRSEEITVSQGENYLNLDICSFSFDQQTYFPLSGPETGDTWAMIELYSNGLYFIHRPDGPAYSEGTWRTEPEFENPFDQSAPYTLYLTECVYGKEKIRKDDTYEDIYTTPVIIELPQEKALEIKGGRSPYFKFTSRSGKSFVFGEESIDDPQPETYKVNISCPSSQGTCEYTGDEFVEAGVQVKFKINPQDGYRVKSVKVTDSYQYTTYFENLTTDSDGYYFFTMPADNVRVGIEFESIPLGFVYMEGMSFDGSEGLDPSTEVLTNGVTIPNLYVCDHEVTQGEYETYCGYSSNQPSENSGIGTNKPAHYISWYDAIVYCNLRSMAEDLQPVYSLNGGTDPKNWTEILNKGSATAPKYCGPATSNNTWNTGITCDSTANGYRLPTEAEWEFAARGGKELKNYTYSGSNTLGDVGWYVSNTSADYGCLEVKSEGISPNTLGIYDMSGNILEWCYDIDYLYLDAGYRVFRGGHYLSNENNCTVNYRSSTDPQNGYATYGFRVVRNAD